MPRSGSVLAARQLRCPTQKRTRYLALKDIRGTIAETQSPAGPLLWQGLKYWLPTPLSPCPLIPPGTQGRTQLLVQQAIDEQERVGWDKAFRGYLNITWGLLEAPHEVDNRPLQQSTTI